MRPGPIGARWIPDRILFTARGRSVGLRIYDTSQLSIAAALTRPRGDGAGFIVGPSPARKPRPRPAYSGPRPPILTLNALVGHRRRATPCISSRCRPRMKPARSHGASSWTAIVPAWLWCQAASGASRVLTAFTQELNAGGGQLLDSASYDASSTDYAAPIGQVLRIMKASRAQAARIRTRHQATFQPRRRGDVSSFFLPGSPGGERLLRPQLKFYFAGDVPTYATADAFEPNSNANQDLDGLIFPGAPWLLGGALVDGVRDATNSAWPVGGPSRSILFAFGFDAARLATALRVIPAQTAAPPASRWTGSPVTSRSLRRPGASRSAVGADSQWRAARAELSRDGFGAHRSGLVHRASRPETT